MKPFQVKDREGKTRYGGAYMIKFKTPEGRYRTQIGGRTEDDATRALRAIEVDLERGVWVDPRTLKRAKAAGCLFKTFGDICATYERDYSDRSESARKNLHDTLVFLHEGVRGAAPLLPATTPIAELTLARVRCVRDALPPMSWATATKNLRLRYFKMILRWAWKHPAIPISQNLADDLESFHERGTRGGDGMTRAVSRDEVFSRSEAARMVEYAFVPNNCDLVTAYMLQTAFLTGLRKGELAGLKWCDIDLERQVISVCRSYSRRGTKSGYDRQVPIFPELVPELRKWKVKSPCSKDDDPVFPDEDGRHRRASFCWSKMVQRIAVGAEVARPCMRRWGHMTRHVFATQWLLEGGSDALLAKILGHVDTSLVHRVYAHFCDFDLVNAANRISLSLSGKATTKATTERLFGVAPRERAATPEDVITQ